MRLHPATPERPDFTVPSHEQVVAAREDGDRQAVEWNGPPVEVATVVDTTIGGVGVRVYDPEGSAPAARRPAVVNLHGGGWVFGSLTTADGVCRRLADRSGVLVVSVDHRHAPEHPWPAAVDDAEAVLAALTSDGADLADLRVDPTRVVVAGDSAGGFLAAVCARRARDDDRPLAGQALVYPVIRREALEGLAGEAGADNGLSVAEMRWFWEVFLGDLDPATVPAADLDPLAADLAGLPPALVATAEHDILRPEGEDYAQALLDAGVDVVATQWQGMAHGFFRQLTLFTAAGAAVDHVAGWVRDLVA